jgi:methionyl-tRNA formyltransferase
MARVIFMGTPDFAVPSLQKLIATQTVVGVVTQPDRPAGRGRQTQPPPVKVAAQAAGISVYQPPSLRSEEAASPLHAWKPDLIVVAAFGQILKPHVLNLPSMGSLNVHASLLPRWRGAAPIQQAILAGDSETGISLMQMDAGLDTGPVYIQRSIPIGREDTAGLLHDGLARLGAEMLGDHLGDILSGRLTPEPQDDARATYAPMIKKEDGLINWSQSNSQVDRHIRAMTPWPGAVTSWQGKLLKVLEATATSGGSFPLGTPGTIIARDGTAIVLTGQGGIQLKRVQLAGKRPLSIEEFLRGQPEFVGGQLGT